MAGSEFPIADLLRVANIGTILSIVISLVVIQRMRRDRTPLGVSIPQSQQQHPVIVRALRRYQIGIVVLGACGILASLWCSLLCSIVIACVVPLGFVVIWWWARREVVHVKREECWFADEMVAITGTLAVSRASDTESDTRQSVDRALDKEAARIIATDLHGLDAGRVHWLAYIVALAIGVLSSLYLGVRWDDIPQRFAVHFSATGEADGWSDKSLTGVFGIQLLNLSLIALLLFTAVSMNPRWIGFRSNRTLKARAQVAVALRWSQVILAVLVVQGSFFISLLNVNTVFAMSLMPESLMVIVGVLPIVVLSVVGAVAISSRSLKAGEVVDKLLREQPALGAALANYDGDFGTEGIRQYEQPDMDPFYKGGMFYYNPDDPALLVDKHDGIGITANFAHWLGKAWIVVVLLVLIVPLCLAL